MFARTERLLLRPGWTEDAPALARAIAEEAIVRNLASAPWPYDLAHARAFLDTERRPDEASFLIFRRTNGAPRLIGPAGPAATGLFAAYTKDLRHHFPGPDVKFPLQGPGGG